MFPDNSDAHRKVKFLAHLREVSPAFRAYERSKRHASGAEPANPFFDKLLANEALLSSEEISFYQLRQIWNDWDPLGVVPWGIENAYDAFANLLNQAQPQSMDTALLRQTLEAALTTLSVDAKYLDTPEGQEAYSAFKQTIERR